LGDPQNLTGVWQGLFSYPRMYRAASFTATLIEAGRTVTGSTAEIAVGGPREGGARDVGGVVAYKLRLGREVPAGGEQADHEVEQPLGLAGGHGWPR